MQNFQLSVFISFIVFSSFRGWRFGNASPPPISKTITVAPSGGDFTSINEAIKTGVPENNAQWIKINILPGEYIEQVLIPPNKPYILLEGASSLTTTISYSTGGNITDATVTIYADNIVARRLCFKNTYNLGKNLRENGRPTAQAVAVFILGDKVSFHECRFRSVQDTIWDEKGRHFFNRCYIEGRVDFIFGNGQSVYENCNINVTGNGYITAQGRFSSEQTTGFVLKGCNVWGTGKSYLGRAWRSHSRVVFYRSKFADVVVQDGWDAWDAKGHEDNFCFTEVDCNGPGADTSKRVKWEKKLTREEVQAFVGPSFYNADGWVEKQP